MGTIAILSTVLPETHYTRHLYKALSKIRPDIVLLAEDISTLTEVRKEVGSEKIIGLWKHDWTLPLSVRKFCNEHSVTTLHLQHEFNMYNQSYVLGVVYFILTLLLSLKRGRRIIVTLHAVASVRSMDAKIKKKLQLKKILMIPILFPALLTCFYKLIAKCSELIVVHSSTAQSILVNEIGLSAENCKVIPHGVPLLSQDQNLTDADIEENKFIEIIAGRKIIFCFGYIVRRKGIEDLLRAAAIGAKDLAQHLVVIGGEPLGDDHSYEHELKNLTNELGLESSVLFTGFLSEKELYFLLRKCEVVVAPYSLSVSSSAVVALAIGANKPVIVSDQPAFREMLTEDEDSLFYKSGDFKTLADKLVKLAHSQEQQMKLSLAAAKLRSALSWDQVAIQHNLELYN